jgi:hypothetical protein
MTCAIRVQVGAKEQVSVAVNKESEIPFSAFLQQAARGLVNINPL